MLLKKLLPHLSSWFCTILRYAACILVALYLPAFLQSGYAAFQEVIAQRRSIREKQDWNVAATFDLIRATSPLDSPSRSKEIVAEALAPTSIQVLIAAAMRRQLISDGKLSQMDLSDQVSDSDDNVHLHPADIPKFDSYIADILGISYEEYTRLAESPVSYDDYDEETKKKAEALYNELFKYTDDYIDPKIYNEKTVAY